MKGYFSRLIQQTGIVFGARNDFRARDAKPLQTESKAPGELPAIDVEERKLIEPQTDEIFRKTHDRVEEGPQKLGLVTKEMNIEHLREERLESGAPREPQAVQSEREERVRHQHEKRELPTRSPAVHKPYWKTTEQKDQEPGVINKSHPAIPKRSEPKQVLDRNELVEQPEMVKATNQESRKDFLFEPTAESADRTSRKDVWRTTLREVRKWLAERPIAADEEVKSYERNMENIDETPEALFDEKHNQGQATFYPSPSESEQRGEPEFRDYHLSIGTISLTVEEPQKETQSNELPPTKRESKPGRGRDGSRLSRHYIRIR